VGPQHELAIKDGEEKTATKRKKKRVMTEYSEG
jgi:hypothetical protein